MVSWRLQQWPGYKGTTNSWVAMEPHLEKIRALLKPANAALRRPGFDSGFNYQKGFVEMGTLPLAPAKKLAQCLSLAVSGALQKGHSEEAVAHLRDLLRLIELEKDEILIISQLVRAAFVEMAVRRTWELLQSPDCTEAQLAAVQSAWQPMDFPLDMARALEMERALTLDFYHQMRNSSAARNTQLNQWREVAEAIDGTVFEDLCPEANAWMEYVHLPLWCVAWSQQDELRDLSHWQRVIEIGRVGRAKSWKEALTYCKATEISDDLLSGISDSASSRGKLNWYDRSRFVFSGRDGSLNGTLVLRALRFQTGRQLAITALALKRYELRHHQPASDLAALVPEFLPAVPRDPMDGQPLRYRTKPDGGFLLYSVGEDGKDDGGDTGLPADKAKSSNWWEGQDMVWPTSATPEEVAAYEKKIAESAK